MLSQLCRNIIIIAHYELEFMNNWEVQSLKMFLLLLYLSLLLIRSKSSWKLPDGYRGPPPLCWLCCTTTSWRPHCRLGLSTRPAAAAVCRRHCMSWDGNGNFKLEISKNPANIYLNTLAVRPSINCWRYWLSREVFSLSNRSSSCFLFSMNSFRFLKTFFSTGTAFWYLVRGNYDLTPNYRSVSLSSHLMESLPRKSNSTMNSWSPRCSTSSMCSTRRLQQPTVSAWSSSFSLPALRASLSIK